MFQHLQILVCTIFNETSSFHLNGNTLGFHPHVQKVEPPYTE